MYSVEDVVQYTQHTVVHVVLYPVTMYTVCIVYKMWYSIHNIQ